MATDRPLVAVYPGSFDPVTNGHLDVIQRATKLVDQLIVAVLQNTSKQSLFPVEERKEMLREATSHLTRVEVDSFDGLLVDYVTHRRAQAVLRGLRTLSDYESEMQMALLNRRLGNGTETIFLVASEQHSFISSRMMKEIITLGGDVSPFVPPVVVKRLAGYHSQRV